MSYAIILDGTIPVLDDNGNPVAGANIRFFEGGTTTPKSIYGDAELTKSIGNELTTNAAGEPITLNGEMARAWFCAADEYYNIKITVNGNDRLWENVKASWIAIVDSSFGTGRAILTATDETVKPLNSYIGQDGKFLQYNETENKFDWVDLVSNIVAATDFGQELIRKANSQAAKTYMDIRSDVLDTVSAIKTYSGSAKILDITNLYSYYLDASDTTSNDTGSTVLVDALNRRWKCIIPDIDVVPITYFGAIANNSSADAITKNTYAFQFALARGVPIQIPTGDFYVKSITATKKDLYIKGNGVAASRLILTEAANSFKVDGGYIGASDYGDTRLEDFAVVAKVTNTAKAIIDISYRGAVNTAWDEQKQIAAAATGQSVRDCNLYLAVTAPDEHNINDIWQVLDSNGDRSDIKFWNGSAWISATYPVTWTYNGTTTTANYNHELYPYMSLSGWGAQRGAVLKNIAAYGFDIQTGCNVGISLFNCINGSLVQPSVRGSYTAISGIGILIDGDCVPVDIYVENPKAWYFDTCFKVNARSNENGSEGITFVNPLGIISNYGLIVNCTFPNPLFRCDGGNFNTFLGGMQFTNALWVAVQNTDFYIADRGNPNSSYLGINIESNHIYNTYVQDNLLANNRFHLNTSNSHTTRECYKFTASNGASIDTNITSSIHTNATLIGTIGIGANGIKYYADNAENSCVSRWVNNSASASNLIAGIALIANTTYNKVYIVDQPNLKTIYGTVRAARDSYGLVYTPTLPTFTSAYCAANLNISSGGATTTSNTMTRSPSADLNSRIAFYLPGGTAGNNYDFEFMGVIQ